MTFKGKLTALPSGSAYAGMLWSNSQLFDKYNLKPPTTLDEALVPPSELWLG